MMETADPRDRNYLRSVAWLVFNGTPIGGIFAESLVGSVQMVIANVVPNQPSQVLFVERDHMVQHLAAAASDPTFGHSILPGRLSAGAFWFQTHRAQHPENL